MSTQVPTISAFMTLDPCAVDEDLTLADARDRMQANNIRHLLVFRDGDLLGVVNLADLNLAEAASAASESQIRVWAAARPVRTCHPDCPLSVVAQDMEKHHFDCMVIVSAQGEALGIFTISDALQALRAQLAGHPVAPQHVPTHHDTDSGDADPVMRVRVKRILRRGGASPSPNDGKAFGRGAGL